LNPLQYGTVLAFFDGLEEGEKISPSDLVYDVPTERQLDNYGYETAQLNWPKIPEIPKIPTAEEIGNVLVNTGKTLGWYVGFIVLFILLVYIAIGGTEK
jgi:hypothetical protein